MGDIGVCKKEIGVVEAVVEAVMVRSLTEADDNGLSLRWLVFSFSGILEHRPTLLR